MQFENNIVGIKKLSRKIKCFLNPLIVMEATGGYERGVAQSLQQQGCHVAVMNPRLIRDFAKALGKLAKTDRIDAEVIALFGEKMQPRTCVKQDADLQKLAELTARRRQIIDMIVMEKNRLDKVSQSLKKSIHRILEVLEKELEEVNQAIKDVIQQDSQYTHKKEVLCSIQGVGFATSTTLLAELPELGQLEARQIVALAGLAPYNRDSGVLRGKRAIKGGRAPVRCALYMATLVAIRYNQTIKTFYQRLRNTGKVAKVAIVACMRKLLLIMNSMIKNNQMWRATAS